MAKGINERMIIDRIKELDDKIKQYEAIGYCTKILESNLRINLRVLKIFNPRRSETEVLKLLNKNLNNVH